MEHATLKHDFVVLDKVRFAVTRLCQQIMQGEFQGVTRDLLVEPEVGGSYMISVSSSRDKSCGGTKSASTSGLQVAPLNTRVRTSVGALITIAEM